MGFTIEQGCPHCGAAIQLEETDRILSCPYCGVKSIIYSPDYFRYVLPDNAPDRELIYAPYLRFKGSVYLCRGLTLEHRIIDITHLGIEFNGIPVSLGLRPQAMRLRFINPEQRGFFLKFSLKAIDILTRAAKMSSGTSMQGILHRAFIGETMSIIYLPLYLDGDRLFDAILNRPISSLPHGQDDLDSMITKNKIRGPGFISTLCPRCGWKLDGERDSVVLLCRNCDTAWEILKGRLEGVDLSIVKGNKIGSLYIPFWRITAGVKGVDIETFSDFIRVTNQPFITDNARGKRDMNFYCPAFKIRPKIFMNLAKQFTVLQPDFTLENGLADRQMHPVTLPEEEAVQALKVILASCAVSRKGIFPKMPRISFNIKETALVYMPFIKGSNDFIQEDTGVAINRPSMEFGRSM